MHDVFDAKILLNPRCGIFILRKKRTFEDLGVDDMNVLRPFETDTMNDGIDEAFTACLGKEHRYSVSYLTFVCEKTKIGDEFSLAHLN